MLEWIVAMALTGQYPVTYSHDYWVGPTYRFRRSDFSPVNPWLLQAIWQRQDRIADRQRRYDNAAHRRENITSRRAEVYYRLNAASRNPKTPAEIEAIAKEMKARKARARARANRARAQGYGHKRARS